ncbi:MAG: hypothetical protein ACYC5G_00430 [Candidatus Doudnabacteria bacterium]
MQTFNFMKKKLFKSNLFLLIILALFLGSFNFDTKSAKAGACNIDSFIASPSPVASGNSTTLGWTQTGCISVSVYLQSGRFLTSPLYTSGYSIDSYTTGPLSYTGTNPTYLLVDETGSVVAGITIPVTQGGNSCVLSNFTSTTLTITSGSSATLTWSAQNCSTLSIDHGVGDVSGLTSKTVTPTATTTYTITGSFGAATASVTINVSNAACAINTFYSSPNPTTGASRLFWTTTNCTDAYIIDPTNTYTPVPVNNPTDGYLVNVTATSTDYYLYMAPDVPRQKVTITKTAACEITNQSATVNSNLSVTVSYYVSNCTNAKITGGYFGFSGTSQLSQASNYSGFLTATTAPNEMSSNVTSMTYFIDAWSSAQDGTIALQRTLAANYTPVANVTVNINAMVNGVSVPASAFPDGFHTNGPSTILGSNTGTYSNLNPGTYLIVANPSQDGSIRVLVNGQIWKAIAAADSKTATAGQTITLNLQAQTKAVLEVR